MAGVPGRGGTHARSWNRFPVDVWAGLVGALVGLLVGPLADRLATNAPLHEPLLRRVPVSRASRS